MPPARLATLLNPALRNSTLACAERAPERHTVTSGRSLAKSSAPAAMRSSGTSRAPGMRPSTPSNSSASRTSMICTSCRCSSSHSGRSYSRTAQSAQRRIQHSLQRHGNLQRLRQQVQESSPRLRRCGIFFAALKGRTTGHADATCLQLVSHLNATYGSYGRLDPSSLRSRQRDRRPSGATDWTAKSRLREAGQRPRGL